MSTAAAQAVEVTETLAAVNIQRFTRAQVRRVRLQRLLASRVSMKSIGDAATAAAPRATNTVAEAVAAAAQAAKKGKAQGVGGSALERMASEADMSRFALTLAPGVSAMAVAKHRACLRRVLRAWWVLSVATRRDRAAETLQRFSVVVRNRAHRRSMRVVFLAWGRWLRWAQVGAG